MHSYERNACLFFGYLQYRFPFRGISPEEGGSIASFHPVQCDTRGVAPKQVADINLHKIDEDSPKTLSGQGCQLS